MPYQLSPETRSRLDAIDPTMTTFFARQLEVIRPKTYDTKLQDLKGRQFIPVDNSLPPGTETYTYRQYTPAGMAKIITNYATDLPRAEVVGQEFTGIVRSLGASYAYSVQELRNAMMAGLDLSGRKALAARRMIEETIDTIAALGDTQNKLGGFINAANTTSYTVPNNAGATSTTWANKTADEIVADLSGIVNAIIEGTKGVEVPDTILLPLAQFNLITNKRMGSVNDTTVLKYFMSTNPHIKTIDWWTRLKGAGASSKDRMMCYRKDPDVLALVIPQEFEQFPVQVKGLEFETPCHARCGGVEVRYPMSIAIADGI